jgi:large subunit ribosomal protein L30e
MKVHNMDLAKELKVALNSGKVEIGFKVGLKTANKKKAKLIVVASNAPETLLAKIKASAGEVPVYNYTGSSWDLGGICGKPFPVSTIAIIDPGESAILKLKEG